MTEDVSEGLFIKCILKIHGTLYSSRLRSPCDLFFPRKFVTDFITDLEHSTLNGMIAWK